MGCDGAPGCGRPGGSRPAEGPALGRKVSEPVSFSQKRNGLQGKAVFGREVPEPISFWRGPKRNGFGLPKKKARPKVWGRFRLFPAPGNDVKK